MRARCEELPTSLMFKMTGEMQMAALSSNKTQRHLHCSVRMIAGSDVWILPYALIFAMAAQMIVEAAIKIIGRLQETLHIGDAERTVKLMTPFGPLLIIIFATLILSPGIGRNVKNLKVIRLFQ